MPSAPAAKAAGAKLLEKPEKKKISLLTLWESMHIIVFAVEP